MKRFKVDMDLIESVPNDYRIIINESDISPLSENYSMDLCCNTNGDNIQCLCCGEEFENAYAIDDALIENEISDLIFTQLHEDPCSNEYLRLIAVKSCVYCSMKKDNQNE